MTPKKNVEKEMTEPVNDKPSINSHEWTDYVLGLLSEDEKIQDNPTTDGLRRVFEIALNCDMIESISDVVQTPDPNNEKRATVVHTIRYILKSDEPTNDTIKYRVVTGSADVYWGNCDKVYRNHPVAVAETRAEGRALRRALRLRKVVAAEELAKDIDDHPDSDSVSKISNNQINFMDVLSKRLDINMEKLLAKFGHIDKNIYNIEHSVAVDIIKNLSSYQQDIDSISEDIKGYNVNWK
jgi:hypothetical protein